MQNNYLAFDCTLTPPPMINVRAIPKQVPTEGQLFCMQPTTPTYDLCDYRLDLFSLSDT